MKDGQDLKLASNSNAHHCLKVCNAFGCFRIESFWKGDSPTAQDNIFLAGHKCTMLFCFFLRYKIYSNHLKQFESLTLTYFVSYIGKLIAWAHRSRLSVRLTLVNILFAINIYICLMSKTKSWYKVHYVERRINIAAFVYRHTNINHHEGKCDNLHIIKVLFDHKNLLCKVTI